MSDLAHRLSSKDHAIRQPAQEDLRVLIAGDVRRLRRIHLALTGVVPASVLIFVSVFTYILATHLEHYNLVGYVLGMVALMLSIAAVLALHYRRAAHRIVALELPQAVGPLVEVVATLGDFGSREIKAALVRLLPLLKSSDANLLTSRDRKHLNTFLGLDEYERDDGGFYGATLKIAVLRALQQIGDETALCAVERLAESARNRQVRSAAQECLPFLQQRSEQMRVEQTLLRASGPGGSPDALLRPARDGEEAAPQQLLRANAVDEP